MPMSKQEVSTTMKNILFAHSYLMPLDPKEWKKGLPYPPLGTLYAAAFLRTHGYRVALFDTMFSTLPDDVREPVERCRPDFFVLYDDGFNYLTKMCLSNMRAAALRMAGLAKEQGCTVIVSGSDATDHAALYLDSGADYVLIGEGEWTLLELVDALSTGKTPVDEVRGLVYAAGGGLRRTPPRPVATDLDSLPFPAWDLIDLRPYRQRWMARKGYFSINMVTTRGCPYRCNWCAKPIYGNRYHARSPEHVLREIEWLQQQVPFDHIWFCDDIFGLRPGWVEAFADLVARRGVRLRFKIQGRADLLCREQEVRALARAGCETAWMGAESGAQHILDAMDKGTTVAQIAQATGLLKKYGIRPAFFIQFGYPGETRRDIRSTIRMINRLLPQEIGISVSYPLPGTRFYDRVKAELQEKSNWTDSGDLALMFRHRYPAAYYRQLHRYVHQCYRAHLSLAHLGRRLGRLVQGPRRPWKAFSLLYHLPATWLQALRLQWTLIRQLP